MKKVIKNERGSMMIEFIGILPLIVLVFVFLWQLILLTYGAYLGHSAASEAAKVYAITSDTDEALEVIERYIGRDEDDYLYLKGDPSITGPNSDGQFTVSVEMYYRIKIIPDILETRMDPIVFSQEVTSQVVN